MDFFTESETGFPIYPKPDALNQMLPKNVCTMNYGWFEGH